MFGRRSLSERQELHSLWRRSDQLNIAQVYEDDPGRKRAMQAERDFLLRKAAQFEALLIGRGRYV